MSDLNLGAALKFLKVLITGPIFSLGDTPVSVMSIVIAGAIIAAGATLSHLLQKFLRSQFSSKLSFDRGLGYALSRILHYVMIAVSLLVALQSIGVNLTSLTVLGGFFGVGLGFGLQNVTSNFISGIILLFEQPIRVGDKVTVQNYIGTVKDIGLRSTVIDTFDNIRLILPNSVFIEQPVINWSHGDPKIRLHVPFGVAYGSDIDAVREAALSVAKKDDVMTGPRPEVRFLGFGDSSLDFELLVWILDPRKQFHTKSRIFFDLEKAFREADIEIPFPQRDLHVRSAPGLAGISQ
ncbi:MAG: mechanosensitive ion channel protein MscS [Elusimicrobia bacterium]|nr:MAG: mechanosensitive ion channel protein MscS [Elusimicrobiota bacterium]